MVTSPIMRVGKDFKRQVDNVRLGLLKSLGVKVDNRVITESLPIDWDMDRLIADLKRRRLL